MQISAFAKINLFLDIERKRPDGYHDIVSVMQAIDWCDIVTIKKTPVSGIYITCTDTTVPTDCKNTAFRAAERFFAHIGREPEVEIHIEKNIPHAAGLAGGSADAAAVLRGLDQMFPNTVSCEQLLGIAKEIGADVPFCMVGGTKLTTGIGEKLTSLPPLPPCYIVCAKLGEGISTPEAYATLDRRHGDFQDHLAHKEHLGQVTSGLDRQDLPMVVSGAYNIFEPVALSTRPAVAALKELFTVEGGMLSMMSGSGPSVFGIFENLSGAEMACEKAKRMGAACRVCRPIERL